MNYLDPLNAELARTKHFERLAEAEQWRLLHETEIDSPRATNPAPLKAHRIPLALLGLIVLLLVAIPAGAQIKELTAGLDADPDWVIENSLSNGLVVFTFVVAVICGVIIFDVRRWVTS